MILLNIRTLFGAERIDYSEIVHLKKNSPDLIVLVIPIVFFFTVLEMVYSWYSGRKNYNTKETLGSLFIGVGNLFISLALKIGLFYGGVFIYNLLPWRMALNGWTFLPCLLVYDLCSYWSHYTSHHNRFFWATHVVHHSAENFNLTVSFRQSWVQHFKIVFFIPVALAGFHPVIFFIVHQVGVLFQFWQHTEYIKKLPPWIEYFIVTPSNHRVHHGSDEKYRDKNFGVIFMVWDRLFKTYQKEEEAPTYGLTTNVEKKLNPLYLNFHEFRDMYRDVKNAKGLRKKLYYVFGKPAKIAQEKALSKETKPINRLAEANL
ncbi:MAG: sterol desaturase family protein [Flavisolibacter sp.]|nr:sterol desaturase family protein [Flavisolibacter sp.]